MPATIEDRNLDARIAQAQQEKDEAQAAWEEASQQEDEARAEIKRRRGAARGLRREAEAEELVPDSGAQEAARQKVAEAEEEEARIEELRGRKKRLRRQRDEAAERLAELKRLKVREQLIPRLAEARAEEIEALGELGTVVLPAFREFLEASHKRTEIEQEARGELAGSRAGFNQRHRLTGWLREQEGETPPEALVGRLVADLLAWLARFNDGPVPDLLTRAGIPLRDGSPRHASPIAGGLESVVAGVEQGRLPDTPTMS